MPALSEKRFRSFLGWAFIISLALHAVTLPFFGVKARAHEEIREAQTITDVMNFRPPTPPPPTPTPQTTRPPQPRISRPSRTYLRVDAPKTTRTSKAQNTHGYVATNTSRAPLAGRLDGTPLPAIATQGPSAAPTAAATIAPPTATPKPACANPNVEAAVKGRAVEPEFPESVRQQGGSGTTEVEVKLDATGRPVAASVHTSSGFPALDQAALEAARATTYTPEIVDCVRTAGDYLFKADFDGA